MVNHLFSYGHGYSATALATRLLPQGWKITGTTRNHDKARMMHSAGLDALVVPEASITTALHSATHLLISAGPEASSDPDAPTKDPFLQRYTEDLRSAAPALKWVGYLSTTGVYGDHEGGWVDESSRLTPATKRGIARVHAEAAWQNIAQELDLPLHIFRLAGIYGPGRGPFAKVKAGTARRIIKKNQVFSRIHVEDIAQILEASIKTPNTSSVFNVCDDFAAPPQDVIGYAAELLRLPLPPSVSYTEANMSPMARSFYAESKKVRNDRIKNELGVALKYPDYQTGLKALLTLES